MDRDWSTGAPAQTQKVSNFDQTAVGLSPILVNLGDMGMSGSGGEKFWPRLSHAEGEVHERQAIQQGNDYRAGKTSDETDTPHLKH